MVVAFVESVHILSAMATFRTETLERVMKVNIEYAVLDHGSLLILLHPS